MLYRAVDTRYLASSPPGQVEIGVYKRDATTLIAWVQKHSAPDCGQTNSTAFIFGVTGIRSVTAAAHDAVAFEDRSTGCGGPPFSGQQTVFFINSKYALMLGWWSGGASYSPTIKAIAAQMLTSFRG